MKDERDRYATGQSGSATPKKGLLSGLGQGVVDFLESEWGGKGPERRQQEQLRTQQMEQLVQSTEFQTLLNKAKLARARQEQGLHDSLSPEEQKQKYLDPSGYKSLRNQGQEKSNVDQAKELIEMADKVGDDALSSKLTKEAERILFGESEQPKEPDAKEPVTPDAVSRADSPIRPTSLTRSATQALSAPQVPIGAIPEGMPGNMPDNRGLFAGSFPGPTSGLDPMGIQGMGNAANTTSQAWRSPGSPGTPAPTFDELDGIKTAQDRQHFGEIEKKIPALRQHYSQDPQGYTDLFAALAKGDINIADAIDIINQSIAGK